MDLLVIKSYLLGQNAETPRNSEAFLLKLDLDTNQLSSKTV